MFIFIAYLAMIISSMTLISIIFRFYEERHDYSYTADSDLERKFKIIVYLNIFIVVASSVILFSYFCC